MTFAYTPYTLPFIVSSILTIALWLFTFPYRSEPAARVFLGLLVAIFMWSAGFIFEIMGVELQTKIFFANLQFLGITAIPIMFLALTMQITGRGQKLNYLLYVLVAFYFFTNIIIWTDGVHHWFRQNPYLDLTSGPFPILVNNYGFWFYYIQIPFYYSAFLITVVIIIQAWVLSEKPYRTQAGILFISFLIPFLIDILYVGKISPIQNFNFTSAAFGISGILIAVALYRYRLFDIVPMANDLIVRNFSEGVIVLNLQHLVIEINPSACQIIHMEAKDVIGKPVKNALWFSKELDLDPKVEQSNYTLRHTELDGMEHYYDVTTLMVKNRREIAVGILITILDVTERQLSYMKTRILATTDPLTGAYNRRHFFELLELEAAKSSRFSLPLTVIMLDIDDFKQFNDKYGHAVGDEILIKFTKTCQENLRNLDLLSRHGGDEFVALLPQANGPLAENIARRLCQRISELQIIAKEDLISVTVSVGVAGYGGHGNITADKLLQTADAAMYQAKENGKNQISVINFEDELKPSV